MNPTKRKIREDYKDLEIIEIKAEEVLKIIEIEKQRKPYTEEEKAEAYYREHICGAE